MSEQSARQEHIDREAEHTAFREAMSERSEPAAASVPLPPAASGGTQEQIAALVEEVNRLRALLLPLEPPFTLPDPSPAPTGAEGRKDQTHPSRVRGMHWHQPPDWELSQRGKGRVSVWNNGTWHTWDANGVGGENAREATVEDAKREAENAIVRQGWGEFVTPSVSADRKERT